MKVQELLKKLRHKVVLYVFNHYYQNFVYNFEKAEQSIQKLTEPAKVRYYEDIKEWLETPAYEIESKGDIQHYYEEIATKAVGDDLLTAYRLLLLYLKNKDIRLRSKAEEYRQKQLLQKRSNDLDRQYVPR